jgi:lipopolysaccharide transport system permease protein
MRPGYQQPEFTLDAATRTITATFRLVNNSEEYWRTSDGFYVGWQMFDPVSGMFIAEGKWLPLPGDLAPAETVMMPVPITLPKERGRYHVYISPLRENQGWFYQQGKPFLLLDAAVENGEAQMHRGEVTTLRSLRRRNISKSLVKFFTLPAQLLWDNRNLIRSMVRRDVLARYRGSAGDVLWTILNPLLLMATYFFVFGIVLQSRFGNDTSRTGFALYFLAGMLPWLAISEAVGRAPHVVIEHRNFVKKLVFPIEVLPVTQVVSGIVTQTFATAVFLIALFVIRGDIPVNVLWLPIILIPQILFTMGLAWFLAALGVYLRDLGQVIGFLLTLWFFLTPICYPEASLQASLSPEAANALTKNPAYVIVRAYRSIFLEASAPAWHSLWKLWVLAIAVFLLGHAWFYKLRKTFADVI